VEIHLCGLLQNRIKLYDEYLRRALAEAAITPEDLGRDVWGELVHKDVVKAKLKPVLRPVADGALEALAAECRSARRPLVWLIIPRAGLSDSPRDRAEDVGRQASAASRLALPVIDLTATFDDREPDAVSVSPGDDHPNALGHKLLFLALARALVRDRGLY